MKRLLTSVALLGACLPAFAETSSAQGYQLPTDTVLKVQVVLDKTIRKGERISHLQLKPTGSETGAHLPEHCMMSADAEINGKSLQLNVTKALCVEPNGHIFNGELNAYGINRTGKAGIEGLCTDSACNQVMLQSGVDYRLKVSEGTVIGLVVNQAEQINIQRRNHKQEADQQ